MKIAIYGYGNLGKGVECAVKNSDDAELYGIFTRRDPGSVKTLTGASVFSAESILSHKDEIDVLVICGGSATDLPEMTPMLAKSFNVVDSFDTHAKIPEHYKKTDDAAKSGDKVALISAGWDPGLFSVNRLYASAVLPIGKDETFWGTGVSQGHSDAIRRIKGVIDARQYTVPIEEAVASVRAGEDKTSSAREKHKRVCFVAIEDGEDKARIENEIKTMPNYFEPYDTEVNFITPEELRRDHSALPHGGSVIRNGRTGIELENVNTVEYSLKLSSNPEFTASAILAYARAIHRMYQRGERGCKTVFDIAPMDLSPMTRGEIIKTML